MFSSAIEGTIFVEIVRNQYFIPSSAIQGYTCILVSYSTLPRRDLYKKIHYEECIEMAQMNWDRYFGKLFKAEIRFAEKEYL